MGRYLGEFLGSFALVFAGTGAIVVNDVSGGVIGHAGIALTFGLIVMTMIYAVGDVSGAHLSRVPGDAVRGVSRQAFWDRSSVAGGDDDGDPKKDLR
jgi:hypothetical protein